MMFRVRLSLTVVAGIMLVGLATAVWMSRSDDTDPYASPASVDLDGETIRVVRSRIDVPERRADPDSRRIEVAYYVIPAATADKRTAPVVMLSGGPGGSYAQELVEDSPRQDRLVHMVQAYRQVSDVVLVDLRGVYGSGPKVQCPSSVRQWRGVASEDDLRDVARVSAERCRDHLDRQGFDVGGYTVIEAARDVLAVADDLAAEQIVLHGISFGSHLAMTTARLRPDRVEALIVGGVEGFDETIDDPQHVREALERISLAASDVWDGRHGVSHPLAALDAMTASELDTPYRAHELRWLAVSGAGYDLSLRSGMPRWPEAVDAMVRGEGRMLRFALRRFGGTMFTAPNTASAATGLFDCTSWASSPRLERLQAVRTDRYLPDVISYLDGYCEGWGLSALPQSFYDSEATIVRSLFIQGDYDVSTPLENAPIAATHFSPSQVVTINGGSHRAFPEALEEAGNFETDLLAWLSDDEPMEAAYRLPPLAFTPLISDAERP